MTDQTIREMLREIIGKVDSGVAYDLFDSPEEIHLEISKDMVNIVRKYIED